MLSILYSVLFTLSLILINPWGASLNVVETGRAETWAYPKIFVVILITLANLSIAIFQRNKLDKRLIKKKAFKLWALYLLSAIIATLLSPFPLHSLFGQSVLGDGLLYWIIIAIFTWSNALALTCQPTLFKSQLCGILSGGLILALSIFPQALNWRIDYTATSGQLSNSSSTMLKSFIWQSQMPIGLYTNRGYVGCVLAVIACLSLVLVIRRSIPQSIALGLFFTANFALLLTRTRGAIVALVIVEIYFFLVYYRKVKQLINPVTRNMRIMLAILLFIAILYFFGAEISRLYSVWHEAREPLSGNDSFLENSLTGRLYLWKTAMRGIFERPIFGWGFNGFGVAHLFVGDWSGQLSSYIPAEAPVLQIVNLYETTFEYLSTDGEIYSGLVLTHKAHNLILDTLLSVGIVGSIFYFLLIGYLIYKLINSEYSGYVGIAAVYLLFTLTWYETAQFSHLFWWILSLGLTQSKNGLEN